MRENGGQGFEDKSGSNHIGLRIGHHLASQRVLEEHPEGEEGGDDHTGGNQGEDQVGYGGLGCSGKQILVLAYVGPEGHHYPHTYGKGEEGLSQRLHEGFGSHLAEVRPEEEAQSL